MEVELVPFEELGAPRGGDPWTRLLPHVWRIVADPDGPHLWTSRPSHDRGDPLSWWTPSLHLMLFGLGWADVGVGLTNWRTAGRPTDTPLLEALERLWGEDLYELQAWAENSPAALSLYRHLAEVTGTKPVLPRAYDLSNWPTDPGHGLPSPIVGGNDPFHLSTHCEEPVGDQTDTGGSSGDVRWVRQRSRRTATLVTQGYTGWLTALHASDSVLAPDSAVHSWRVDVVAETMGWLGTYRRSRVTGRWFSGRHRDHLIGWPSER